MNKKWVFIIVFVLILAIGGILGYGYFDKTSQYSLADDAFNQKNYEEALNIFNDLGTYKDSEDRAVETKKYSLYQQGLDLIDQNEFEKAYEILSDLGNFKLAIEKAEEAQHYIDYNVALKLLEEGNFQEAELNFAELDGFLDSEKKHTLAVSSIDYKNAIKFFEEGDVFEAFDIFRTLGDFEDTHIYLEDCSKSIYEEGLRLMEDGEYLEAETLFLSLGAFEDSAKKASECDNYQEYQKAVKLFENGERYDAYIIFKSLGDHLNSEEMAIKCAEAPTAYVDKFIYAHPDYEWQQVQMQVYTNLAIDEAAYIKIYSGSLLVKAIYFAPGDNYSIGFPNGYYSINIAYGNEWFGEKDMFGPDGIYSRMVFEDGETDYFFYKTYSYSLRLDVGDEGNVNNKTVKADNF